MLTGGKLDGVLQFPNSAVTICPSLSVCLLKFHAACFVFSQQHVFSQLLEISFAISGKVLFQQIQFASCFSFPKLDTSLGNIG